MIFFQYILSISRGVIIILSMIIFLLAYAFSRVFFKHTKRSGLRLRKLWLRLVGIPVLNIKISKEGSPIDKPALYVANHRSFADPIAMTRYLDAFVIAKAEVDSYPILSKGAEATGVIYVKRESKESRTNARNAFINVINQGYNILVYPEGTISTQKHSLEFKKGTFFSAVKENIPVVPIAIEFQSKKDLWLIPGFVSQYLNQFGKWSTKVKIKFGPEMIGTDGQELATECQNWINKEMLKMQEGWITYSHKH